jgi:hypothetical protein
MLMASAPGSLPSRRLSQSHPDIPAPGPRFRLALIPRPSTRGQAILTIAVLERVHRSQVSTADPRVTLLLGWPAYAVDCLRVRYDCSRHGSPTVEALSGFLAQLVESENLLGPVTENFA